jgi:hypothetical protein
MKSTLKAIAKMLASEVLNAFMDTNIGGRGEKLAHSIYSSLSLTN